MHQEKAQGEWNLVFLNPVQSSVCRGNKQIGYNGF